MKEYHDLLHSQNKLSRALKCEKQRLHNVFYKENKKKFIILDILVILIVLMNWGALMITNSLVEKRATEQGQIVEYSELNPVQAELNNWEQPEKEQNKAVVMMLLRQVFFWSILLFIYIYYRNYVFTEEGMFIMVFIICFYFLVLGSDFINDLGFWIGKVMFR